jgi:hypothetical protein
MTPYEPPKMQTIPPPNTLPMYIALTVFVLLALGGIGLLGFGLYRIFVTSPGMGIPVDALGNRLPVEGYPHLWFGLVITCVFSVFALMTGSSLFQMHEEASFSRLNVPVKPSATNI